MTAKEYSNELLNELETKFGPLGIKVCNPRRVYIGIDREKLPAAARFLYQDRGCRLSIATGIDTRDGVEILYHFSHDATGVYYTLKTLLPKHDLSIQSLATFMPAADWIEREIREMLGVTFVGHPNPAPLLTSDDWPADQYPLRRDFEKG